MESSSGLVPRSVSILVVEDDPRTRSFIERLLAGAGYDVRTAAHAGEAHGHLHDFEFEPALILMDIQLPGQGGLELARQIKSNPKRRHIPIVAMTAFDAELYKERALRAGCTGYLAKPFHTTALLSVVALHLDESRRSV
jgi:two-component system cell cycle response regulator DivK